ncbi:MAG: AMP-binding protein [Actinomycetota bacterium]|nr:AMP-binding protein [Actinomycetota bacterium]
MRTGGTEGTERTRGSGTTVRTGGAEPAGTIAALLAARAGDDRIGLVAGDRSWTWDEVVRESRARAAIALAHRPVDPSTPFHIGVLLPNVPEYLFWLGGAALAGAVAVGINPTRRGTDLARDIAFTCCHLVVTDGDGAALIDGLETGVPPGRVLRVDRPVAAPAPAAEPGGGPTPEPAPDDLYLLLFTSGTTSAPKAVRCTQGRLAEIAARAGQYYGFVAEDVCYCPMPLFHGNAIMALWAPALAAGARIALTPRFSASGFADDVRRYGATRFTYVGRALAYVLATDERPDDAETPLRFGFGTEASARDRAEFERRFGCTLVEGYGSSEGGLAINRTPDTPPGALGRATDDVVAVDPETGEVCLRARIGPGGAVENPEEAIGELVNRSGPGRFEGYWRHPEAEAARVRNGWYWTGDLGYVDEDGFVWFAGRTDDWLRVDSENIAAAPVERILERHPDVVAAAVYAVPDPRTGDQVMAALELRPGTDPTSFATEPDGSTAGLGAFLAGQDDLGTKWAPRFVRVTQTMPLTATGKITKAPLRAEGWRCGDPVFIRDGSELAYRPLTPADTAALDAEARDHDRLAHDRLAHDRRGRS